MTCSQTDESTLRKPLRLWPGVVAAVLLIMVRFVIPTFVSGALLFGVIGAAIGALAIVVWWMFFSRALWPERLGAIALMIAALIATRPLLHKSIAGAGMGMLFYIFAVPVLSLTLVAWASATRRFSAGFRGTSMVATILLASGMFTLVRTAGITGEGGSELHWRWSQTPEERLLSQVRDVPIAVSPTSTLAETPKEASASMQPADWPGFRGAHRDGVIHGVQIETDWSKSPPVQMWRRPIGPGWSSFAVDGDHLYTQEQRGEDEIVSCYRVSTGTPVWRHQDALRFWESNGGAGPRATPTISNGRIYAFGATGILNVLDVGNGSVIWSRNVASDANKKVPMWGFSSAPLVVDDVVIVAAAGKLIAYDIANGNPRWFGPDHGGGYSSPHFLTIDGVPQILLLSSAGATSVAPSDGMVLWEHAWPGGAIVQPALTEDGDVLINSLADTGGAGIRRLTIARESGFWTVEERWTSRGLKPYYNDFVIHKGHAYGFDGTILACIDLEDGTRKWKGGRYGAGQLVLLPDQDVLLVLSEEGELVLVTAVPDQFKELARFPAIDGKTWNHPVLVGSILLVRNGEEMAAFRLALAKS